MEGIAEEFVIMKIQICHKRVIVTKIIMKSNFVKKFNISKSSDFNFFLKSSISLINYEGAVDLYITDKF